MRIRRFNENQAYLTEPFDPEESVSYDIKSVYDSIERNCKYIADKYNLDFKVESQEISNNFSGLESRLLYRFCNKTNTSRCQFFIWDDKPEVKFECFALYDKEREIVKEIGGFFTWSNVEEYVKKYFNI